MNMLKQSKNFLKKYKLQQLQQIKKTYNFIYFFRYNDFSINKLILLKKILKKLNYKSLIINQTLTAQIFSKLKGQGSILIIYGNNDSFSLKDLIYFKKLQLIYMHVQNNIYSYLKLKQILNQNNFSLNYLIVQPLLNFIYYLRKI